MYVGSAFRVVYFCLANLAVENNKWQGPVNPGLGIFLEYPSLTRFSLTILLPLLQVLILDEKQLPSHYII